MRKITVLISIIASSSLTVFPPVIGTDVLATANVQEGCSLDVSPTSISFGNLVAGSADNPADNPVSLVNNAGSSNVPADVYLQGTDWNLPNFDVGKTKYSFNGGSSTPLTTISAFAGTVPQDATGKDVSFIVSVPANQAAGLYTQTITVTFECETTTTTTLPD